MKKIEIPRKVQFVRRPCPRALKAALALLIVFSMAALIALGWIHSAIQAETEKLKDQAADVSYRNGQLEQRIHDPDSVENVKKVAEEKLGLVEPDSIVIDPK